MTIELLPGELNLKSQTGSYKVPGGKKYTGRVIITNKRILCDTPFDLAARSYMQETMFIRWGSRGYLEMDRQKIHTVTLKKGFINNDILVVMKDGSKHLFTTRWWVSKKLLTSIVAT